MTDQPADNNDISASLFRYTLIHKDSGSEGRVGIFSTPRGEINTPTFMPVGTQGTVKGVTVDQLVATGAQIILGNTYHLALRPGSERIRGLGGLHQFVGWQGNILTDSGGFQIFSLADRAKITEKGAEFQSHIDGRRLQLTPEDSIRIQEDLGSDVAMVLDHVVALPSTREVVAEACDRSIRWAARCLDVATRNDQAKFAIIQGGLDVDLRIQCANKMTQMNFDGFAVGGLSVGEPPPEMYRILSATCPHLPADKPRYLMGVGKPIDLVEGVLRGIDMFDCVMPTRNGRNALAFTSEGTLRLRNQKHANDPQPLELDCPCIACRHSRAYIRHLFVAEEMLGPILLSIHNLTFYQRLMKQCRDAINNNSMTQFAENCRVKWVSESSPSIPDKQSRKKRSTRQSSESQNPDTN